MKKLCIMILSLMAVCTVWAQADRTSVSGKVVDEAGEPLPGASIVVPGTTQGATSDVDGNFVLSIASGVKEISINYIGFKTRTVEVSKGRTKLGTIILESDSQVLEDVVITQSVAVTRKTPIAVSTVSAADIEYRLGGQEFPEILKSTPGVYVTKDGGGYGDSKINMRGFQSANVAVMVNGVPVNDMEWGGVYWSNWAGLSDVTRSMQTQRGLGASKVSAPSVGGSVNIVTNGIEAKQGGTVSFGVGNDGAYTMSFSLASGLTKNGWAFSVLGARRWGDGYIQGTNYTGYNWFVNISKRINDQHQLSLTAFGAPQKHAQRNSLYAGLTVEEWQKAKQFMGEKDMYRYNASYGFDRYGKQRYTHFNEYHKPQISLNHQWQIDYKSSLSTALYMSIGRGSGLSGQGRTSTDRNNWRPASNGILNTDFLNPDGTFAYDKVQELNAASDEGARMVMAKQYNNHMWYGLLSTYTNQITPALELSAGVDVRYYIGQHYTKIDDLYDGAYFIDDSSRSSVYSFNNSAALDPNWKYEKLGVGDIVYRDYDGHTHQEGVFAQLEYSKNKLNAFVSGSVSNTGYWRYDRFYYDAAHAESEHLNFIGFTAKGGVNYNVTKNSNFFANLGYISRAPFFSGGAFLQSTTSNAVNNNPLNEKIFSAEIGYGLRAKKLRVNVNAYYTKWMDKSTVRSIYIRDLDDYARMNMGGVDARHMGIEVDFRYEALRWLDITGMLSLGDWTWDSNARGYLYDSNGQPLTKALDGTVASGIQTDDHAWIELNQKGIKVGGSAQTTAALGVNVRPMKGLRVSADWNVYANNYADFYVNLGGAGANSSINVQQPWRIPWGHQLDLSASYRFNMGKVNSTLYLNINNLYNYNYIMDAQSPAESAGIWQNAYAVMYSFGTTYTVRLKINF